MRDRTASLTLGQLGETLVADWLNTQGGNILSQRWHTRRGELDLVVYLPAFSPIGFSPQGLGQTAGLAFVEVKTRSRGNWDENGLLALTPSKQQKLWHSARAFLASHPAYGTLPCRFDLALVKSQAVRNASTAEPLAEPLPLAPILGQPCLRGAYSLTIQHYLIDAFRLD